MLQTLFEIPYEVAGVPLFGMGLLLVAWVVFSLALVARLALKQGWTADTLSYIPLLVLVGAAIAFLPRVFPDGLPIRGYGLMLLLAVVSGVGLAAHRARQMGVHPDVIFSLALWMFLGGIGGARLFHVVEYWDSYRGETWQETLLAVINVPQGGLVVYGSLIGAVAAFLLVTALRKLPPLALADLIAPTLLLGLALGRVGCLLNGCCYGGHCDLPWAVTFPIGSPPYQSQVVRGEMHGFQVAANPRAEPVVLDVRPGSLAESAGLKPGMRIEAVGGKPARQTAALYAALAEAYERQAPLRLTTDAGSFVLPAAEVRGRSHAVHPTQVYSALGALLLCLFLLAWYPFRRRDGEVTALMLTLYPIGRFLIEAIRTDEPAVFGTGLSISQNISIVVVLATAALWIYIVRQPAGSILPVGRGRGGGTPNDQ